MEKAIKVLIFTDLDGSLLHRDTFKFDEIKDYLKHLCINILTITIKMTQCPRGEIGRHKGLKILALLGVPVRVWPRAPLMNFDE